MSHENIFDIEIYYIFQMKHLSFADPNPNININHKKLHQM